MILEITGDKKKTFQKQHDRNKPACPTALSINYGKTGGQRISLDCPFL